jgi:hypothetical protein
MVICQTARRKKNSTVRVDRKDHSRDRCASDVCEIAASNKVMAVIETFDLRASPSGATIGALRFGDVSSASPARKPDRSPSMTVEDPLSLRSSLYIAARGAAPPMRSSFAEGGKDTQAPRSHGLLAWIEGYFRHTSADRMAVASLAFWG